LLSPNSPKQMRLLVGLVIAKSKVIVKDPL
jgi:hypothetical protein